MNVLCHIAETAVCTFLYCASNTGHKSLKSQDYPTEPGHGMGSVRLYHVYFRITNLQPAIASPTSTTSNLTYLILLLYKSINDLHAFINLLYTVAETVVCIFLYCASNKGHKIPKSQEYAEAPSSAMGSERSYEVQFVSSPLQPPTESATSTASNLT